MKMISSYIMCVYIIYRESIRSTSKCIMYGGALLLENSSILLILASTTTNTTNNNRTMDLTISSYTTPSL